MYAIKIENLTRAFASKLAVNKLNMNVEEGAIYGFIGENGSGKSTTQKLICGLLNATEGKIELFGKSHSDAEVRSQIGVIIESPALFLNSSAYENMMMQALNLGIKKPHDEIMGLLEMVGLKNAVKKKTKEFSLGMKQRLAIAQTLLGKPHLLVLDEPTNGLDPEGIIDIRKTLIKINRERKITILISSHILGELSKIATHYGIIKDGEMIEEISEKGLREKCKEYIAVRTSDNKAAAEVIKRAVGNGYQVIFDEDEVRIYNFADGYNLNKALYGSGIIASEISQHRMDLEEYFFSVMGGRKSA